MKSSGERVAIVTGGGRSIGRAIALKLAEQGCVVVVCSRTQSEIDVTAGIIQEQGGRSAAIRADVASEDDVGRVVRASKDLFGRVDVLVNNAGNYLQKGLEQTSRSEWDWVVGANLTGPFLMTRAVVPAMRAVGGGRIVNVSSLFGVNPGSSVSAYVAAKAGLIGLTKALALELLPARIQVNAVCPGAVNTSEQAEELESQHYKVGEHLIPRDIAEVVAFLVSDQASQITGGEINVPGATHFAVKTKVI
jgi:3-oxoacyl-[acyl-carrier protein] reductase